MTHDPVNHPTHSTSHPSDVECIEVTESRSFLLGNAIKYVWRAGEKGDAVEDLRKALWYAERWLRHLRKDTVMDGIAPLQKYLAAETDHIKKEAI